MPTKNAERVREHRQRRKAHDEMIQAVLDTNGVQFTLTPAAPYVAGDDRNPLRDGIKITYVMSERARDKIKAYAVKERGLTFEGILQDMDMQLLAKLFEEGFFQHEHRLKDAADGRMRTRDRCSTTSTRTCSRS